MEPLAFIVGLIAVCTFILALPYLFEKGFPLKYGDQDGENWIMSHAFLKLTSLGIAIGLMLLVPTIALQEKDTCSIQLNQTLSAVSGTTTTTNHTYSNYCFNDTHRTESIFFTTSVWSLRIFFAYMGIWIICLAIYSWRNLKREL